MRRRALIEAPASRVEAYLPGNYRVLGGNATRCTVEGTDYLGWTLHGYVLPRLASGLMFGQEIPA